MEEATATSVVENTATAVDTVEVAEATKVVSVDTTVVAE